MTLTVDVALPRANAKLWRQFTIYGLVLALGCIWGLQYSAAKLAGEASGNFVGTLLTLHLLLLAAFLPALVVYRQLFLPTVRQLCYFAAIGLVGYVLQFGLQILAAPNIKAAELTLIMTLTPAFIVVFAFLLRSEALDRPKLIGVALGLAAALPVVGPAALAQAEHSRLIWLLAAVVIPAAAAAAVVLMSKFWPPGLTPLQVATGNVAAVVVMLTPAGALAGGPAMLDHTATGTLLLTATIGLEFYLIAVLVRIGGAVVTSGGDFIALFAGLVWSHFIFGEVPTLAMAIAAILAAAAIKLTAGAALQDA